MSSSSSSSSSSLIWYMDLLGFYGFFVIMLVVLAHIHSHVWELVCFVVGMGGSIVSNKWLKSVIRDPRPTHPVPLRLPSWGWWGGVEGVEGVDVTDATWYQGSETYGYPSGHAQLALYALTFLGGVLWSHRLGLGGGWGWWWYVYVMCIFVACVTLYQRWKYRRHTVEQLWVGAVLGILWGWGAYSSISVLRTWVLLS
jgi:membrane-associated phospholipid phosphatase